MSRSLRAPHDAQRTAAIVARLQSPERPTMSEVGIAYGLTRERIRQIAKTAGVTAKGLGPRHPERFVAQCALCGETYRRGDNAAHVESRGHRLARLMSHVAVSDGCWEWTATRYPTGYGHISHHGRAGYAHRESYALFVGPIPKGYDIDHLCRNPPCVKPSHIEAVTPRTNILRGVGRGAKNARKTHCNNGHPFDEANTRLSVGANGQTRRACRACACQAEARSRRKRRGLAA